MAQYYKPLADTIIYLNTNYNCTITSSGGKNIDFSWILPDIVINDLGYLSVLTINPINHSTTAQYTFRLKNVDVDSKDIFCSDYGPPILNVSTFGTTVSSGLLGVTEYGLTLPSQTLRNITINVSDSISNMNSGIGNTVQFIIGLKIKEFDPKITRIDNPYAEGRSNMRLGI